MSADLVQVEPDAQALDADPVGYMAVVLHRAKGWLAEAQSIDAVRDTKAIAVGYESVIREKELAFDAQLSATEIVRRCERRIGELVHEGQRDGSVLRTGETLAKHPLRHAGEDAPRRAREFFSNNQEWNETNVLARAPDEQFEAAVEEARTEGNLSRAIKLRTGHSKQQCAAGAIVETVNAGRGGNKLESWWS